MARSVVLKMLSVAVNLHVHRRLTRLRIFHNTNTDCLFRTVFGVKELVLSKDTIRSMTFSSSALVWVTRWRISVRLPLMKGDGGLRVPTYMTSWLARVSNFRRLRLTRFLSSVDGVSKDWREVSTRGLIKRRLGGSVLMNYAELSVAAQRASKYCTSSRLR